MLKKERLEIIRKYYPNAITLIDLLLIEYQTNNGYK